jgi:hypothetical protein
MEKLTRYKSFKTFQRVNNIKVPEPYFENSEFKEFETKFKDYCLKFQQDLDGGRQKIKPPQHSKDAGNSVSLAERQSQNKNKTVGRGSVAHLASDLMRQNLLNQRTEESKKRVSEIKTKQPAESNNANHLKLQDQAANQETIQSRLINKQGLQSLENNIKAQHKKLETSESLGIVHPIVKMFGNTMVASVFESLVIKTIEELFNVKVTEDLPISGRYYFNLE